jgi:hypothetical protein
MPRIRIDLDMLMDSLEDHCFYTHYYLDRETGEIIIQSENDPSEREETDVEIENPFPQYADTERFIPLEPMESRRGFDIMEGFAGGLPGGEARDRLLRALRKRKPFRNFKDVLYDFPELGEKWRAYHNDRMKAVAEEWLKHSNINYEFFLPGKN